MTGALQTALQRAANIAVPNDRDLHPSLLHRR
jgi:hypothetical protein